MTASLLRVDEETTLVVRPIVAADRSALAAAFARLSPESRMRRFLGPKPTLTPRELTYLTDVDHVTHEALVAALESRGEIVAVARYAAWPATCRAAAEVAVAVLDSYQRRGIGSALVAQVIARAEANGFDRLTASISWNNVPARRLVARLGFRPVGSGDGLASYRRELRASRLCAA